MAQETAPLPELSVLNRHAKLLPGPGHLHQLVRPSSATGGPAIHFLEDGVKTRSLTYEDLHAASDALAASIRARLATLEHASTVIPVLLPQSPDLYIALLAILKAGKAFCPIGLDSPPDRIQFILNDISASIVVTTTKFQEKLPSPSPVHVLLLDHDERVTPATADTETRHQTQSRLAYVLYTSGSTGLPKAVSVSHRAVTQSLLAHDRHIPPFTRFLQFAAPTFDVSIFEIFFPLYRGCTLVGCTRKNMLSDLPATMALLRVDAAELTPTVVSNLLRGRNSVPDLRLLLTIGEMLTRDVIEEFGGSETQPSMLWGMYGPTEAAIHCTLQPSFSRSSPPEIIGYPLDTVTAIIAAPISSSPSPQRLTVLPKGEVGELVIGGLQVADEYLNRSELTSASFLHDSEYGYLYRTGDKARLCNDGTLECLGRIASGQVKLKGQRVELGEVEQTIMKVDKCHSAVAAVIQDTLVAFCATGSSAVSRETVQETCGLWLPDYMIPTDFFFIDRMPQLPSGKVDKKALETEYFRSHGRSNSLMPRSKNGSKESINSIFQRILGRDIEDNENFSNVGLDSLRSIRLASELRQQGYAIGSLDVLAAGNIKGLKILCDGSKVNPHESSTTDIRIDLDCLSNVPDLESYHADIACILPCTPLQEAMLSETAMRPSAYCNWIEVELFERCTFSRIRSAIEMLVQRNEILRTGFCMANVTSSHSETSDTNEPTKPTTASRNPTVTRAVTELNADSTPVSSTSVPPTHSDPGSSFVQIVWKRAHPATIFETSSFSRTYSIDSAQSLLHPLTVQVNTTTECSRLLFQMHHAIYDGWTFDLMLRDLHELLRGNPTTPRPQYREVTQHYLEISNSNRLSKSVDYWGNVLRDYHPQPLPNFNGNAVPSTGLCSIHGEYEFDSVAFYSGAKEHLIHPQVFYQAAVALVISQYAGAPDIVIGSVMSGRTIPVTRVEEAMGPCIATLPYRVDMSCTTVEDLLQDTHRANRTMLEHCVLPLRNIAKLCHLRPGERLFDVLLVWQESLVSAANRHLSLRKIDGADDSEFKITVELEPCDKQILYRITYDPSTIPAHQAKMFAKQIQHTVQFFLNNRTGTLEQVKRSFNAEELSIVHSQPDIPKFQHGPAHAVEKWATKFPDKDALVFGSIIDGVMKVREKLSYDSLNARANQLAHALVAVGVGHDQLVCVILDKSVHLYVSILAILKTGCGYLPIVPDTPSERVHRILTDAAVKVCVSDRKGLRNVQRDNVVILDPQDLNIAKYPEHNLKIPYDGSHLAYAVFTSGSTGKPKGVLVTQDNLMSNLHHLSSLYPYNEDSKLLQSCSQAFDVSVFEIFFSWYVGICLCTATQDDLFFDFEASINLLDVTHLSLTPTVASLVDPARTPKVELLVTAGEALTEIVKRRWAGKKLYQGYGPSETTNICTVKPSVADFDMINNIGPVFPNTSLLILEPGSDNIVLRGAVGELCFGGTQVFRGYLNRPDLNAAKIFQSHYGRIYRSGDLGRLLPNGDILSLGRLDDQVKIRGQRVELGEITSLIMENPAVHDCATVLVEGKDKSQKLVVFWVPSAAMLPQNHRYSVRPTTFCALDPEKLRSHIQGIFDSICLQLPAYMLPTHIVPINLIPMTSQAKIDKTMLRSTFRSLAQLHLEATAMGSATIQDSSEFSALHTKIATALSHTLGLPLSNVKRGASFFSLGMDSVSAIYFSKVLRDTGFRHLPVSDILKNPTVERLTAILGEKTLLDPSVPEHELTNVFNSEQLLHIHSKVEGLRVDRILPCTSLQEAMLSASASSSYSSSLHGGENSGSEGVCYYNTMSFAIHGNLNRLKTCWERMIHRHDILRTTFVSTDHPQYSFAQVIFKQVSLVWDKIKLGTNIEAYAAQVIFDLLESHRPPVRLAIQEGGTSMKLVFCCHHALYDGVAMRTLLEEVQSAYFEQDLLDPIPYEAYLRHMMSSSSEEALRFWTSSLAGFEPVYFPDISGRVLQPKQAISSVQRTLQIPLSVALKQCRMTTCSLLSEVQAAWAKLLHFVLSENSLCFGNVVSGRTLAEEGLDRLVAPCFNTLPLRLSFDFHDSNSELCKKLHALNIDMLPFQLTSLRWIQSKIRQDEGPLFDTLVILQQSSSDLNDAIWTLESDHGHMDLPMVCEVIQDQSNDKLVLRLHHQQDLCSKDDAEILAEIFDNAFHSVICFPMAAAHDTFGFPDRLLGQSNLEFQAFELSNTGLLHSAFEQNANVIPDVIALDFRHLDGSLTTLTFQALNRKANQLASQLIQHGIIPEDVVPIYMAKSPEFYISILGVLKAGAAFSPVHPDLPEARKKFMLSELQPKLVLACESFIGWLDKTPVVNVTTTGDSSAGNPMVAGISPTNIAYCLYTSGSTGLPKAVSMEHCSPVQTIESSRSLIPWDHGSRLLQYAAITFDMCYYDCFLAWTFGFTLCAADQEMMLNNLTDSINTLKVDLLDLTPSVATSLSRNEVLGVKWLYCIGEPMSPEVVSQWNGVCVNSYGPTEAAFCTTIFSTNPAVKTSVIGRPFPTTSFAIMPLRGERSVPVFGIGELYIGGVQLARGYYGQPQLTEERFVRAHGQRFYKSGDMVRMLGDGNFEFLGRTDDQIKIRGLRVELGEINKTLIAGDEMITAATTQILKRDDQQKEQLVAFLVTQCWVTEKTKSRLRDAAKQKAKDVLPSYMVPHFYIFVDKIPKSMAGKIDKRVLTDIFRESAELNESCDNAEDYPSDYQWNPQEIIIRNILSKLSGMRSTDIKPRTTIFQLGLDSISAVQVAAALRKQDIQVNAADVLRYPNCRDLAAYIEQSSSFEIPRIQRYDFEAFDKKYRTQIEKTYAVSEDQVEAICPCTPLQNSMLSQFIAREGEIYFNFIRLRSVHYIDLDQLKSAWRTMVRKHRMLRTGFVHVDDRNTAFAMLHYAPDTEDLPWENSIEYEGAAEEWRRDSARKAVKHLHKPPWRVRVTEVKGLVYLEVALLHAIFDAQSLRLFLDDVTASYQGALMSPAVPLEPVIEQILYSSHNGNTTSNKFWEGLGKEAVPTRFPNMSPLRYDPEPPVVIVKTSSRTLEELGTGCKNSNISLQAAGLASWAALLSAYVGEPSVTFGVVLSGRSFEAAESTVFPCINTVPFVCRISDQREKVLDGIMALTAELQQHQFTPLNHVQKLMGNSKESLFDSIFAFQKHSNDNNLDKSWTVVDERASIEYPLSIELEPKDGRLNYRLTFLPHILPTEQAELLLNQLDHLLQHYVFPNSDDEVFEPRLYSVTPPKISNIPSETKLLHELVEQAAVSRPDHTAFEFATSMHHGIFRSRSWTYTQLDGEGNRIANLLLSHGVQPGELVGICFEKCPEASFAILGILKAGCAFVALDPGAPDARKAYILDDSGASVVLTMTAQSASFQNHLGSIILNLDEEDWHSKSSMKPILARNIDPQDRSYCLYTSGTTGTPKGCEITHENAVQAMLAFRRLFAGHWDANSRWLQFASFHFDVSVLEQYWSWSVGICVVSAPRDLIFEDLAGSIRTLQITHIDLTPSLARILHPDDVPTLQKGIFITGGESLKQEILDVWGSHGVIYNGYGPTEATIGCTMYARVPTNGKPSNIGPQFDNVGSYVLRLGSDIPVLRGGVGELCISGQLVGKGYLNRPELTKERFSHLRRFDERVYRTGDLVRLHFDGTFDFLGRADDQVKLRGQRLEIGEINSVIRESDIAIADVATLILKHPKQQKEQLVAFIVIESGRQSQSKILIEESGRLRKAKETCEEKLPPYMVPTHFVALNTMPLSVNNKVEARKLKEMYEDLSVNDLQLLSSGMHAKDETWSKQENIIREVLKESLNTADNHFTKDTSFFELGMDSISVIGVSKAFKQAGLQKATASTILKNTTVRRLAKALTDNITTRDKHGSVISVQQAIAAMQHRHKRTVAEKLFTNPLNIEALAPCTPLQQGMIAKSLESKNELYYNSFRFQLQDDVNVEKLHNAWDEVFASIQILRTVFVNTEDGFVQAVLRNVELAFEEIQPSSMDVLEDRLAKKRENWISLNRTHIKRPLEVLVADRLDGKTMILHIFHGIYDGNSINFVFNAVWNAYKGQKICDGPAFHLALPYGPLRPEPDAKIFWNKHLTDRGFQRLPTSSVHTGDTVVVVKRDIHHLSGINATRRELNVTTQAIVQSCWTIVLHQYLQTTVTLGMIVSGRNIDFEDADRVIGPMFNTIPFQYRARQHETWKSVIKQTHEFNVAAHPYQHTPLRDITKWLKRGPDQPLFDNLFVFQIDEEEEQHTKNGLWTLQDSRVVADYPLAVEVEQRNSGALTISLVAQSHIVSTDIAAQLVQSYEEALRQAIEDSDIPVETFVMEDSENTDGVIVSTHNAESNPLGHITDFTWSSHAEAIRKEIAELSGASIEEVDANTSIFELGLDSIDAIKLSSKLKRHGIDLAVSGIMRELNIANMMRHIAVVKVQKYEKPSDMIYRSVKKQLESYLRRRGKSEGVERVLPPTPLQEAMVAEMMASDFTRYYNHDVLRLRPGVDAERMREAWTVVMKHSPILRTSFILVDDPGINLSYAQVVKYEPHEFWQYTNLECEPDFLPIMDNIKDDARAKGTSEALFHIHLFSTPEHKYMVLSVAHALYDGFSLGLLHSDVRKAYDGTFQPRPSYEPALHEILVTSGADAAAFWHDYLSGAKVSYLPRRSGSTPQLVHREQRTSGLSLDAILSFAKKHNITPQTLGQVIHGATIASYTNSLDVTFGSVLSGRDDETMSKLLYPTMNTVAIRMVLHASRCDMLHYVQENFSNIRQFQHFPLRKALALVGATGELLQSLFIYQKSLSDQTERDAILYDSVHSRSDVEYPVCVEMEIVKEELVWRCAVRDDVFDERGTRELLERLDEVLKAIVAQPDAPIIDFAVDGHSVCGLPAFTDVQPGHLERVESTNLDENQEKNWHLESPTARVLREVLALVSQIPEEEITPSMTIFHIGLDSISAIKVTSLLRKRGITLSVGQMLRAGTVEEMSLIADEKTSDNNNEYVLDDALLVSHPDVAIDRAGVEEKDLEYMLPATAGQTYMLSMWLNSHGTLFYPEFKYRIKGATSFEAVRKAWKSVVAQNPILRTSFHATTKERMPYVQFVMRNVEANVTDISAMTSKEAATLKAKISAKQPYAHLFASRTGPTTVWSIQLKIHHALYDGVSLPLIVQQLQDHCNAAEVVAPTQTIADVIAATSSRLAIEQRKSFWTHYLKGFIQRNLPQPSTRSTLRTEVFKPAIFDMKDLSSHARKHGLTIQSLFLAMCAKVYAGLTGTPSSEDTVIGLYLANRSLSSRTELHQAVVPTVNLIPLRVSKPIGTDIFDMAAQIQYDIQEISAPANASVSLWEVREWTNVKVDCFVNFLKLPTLEETCDDELEFEPVINWGEESAKVVELDGTDVTLPEELLERRVDGAYLHALDIEATITNGSLDLGIFVPTDMIGLEEGEKLLEKIQAILERTHAASPEE